MIRGVVYGMLLALMLIASCTRGTPAIARHTYTVAQAEASLWPGGADVALAEPTEEQRRALDELLQRLWVGVSPPGSADLAALAERAHMALELWTVAGRSTWVVRERTAVQRGFGIYLVHAAPLPARRPILLQAPHVYFDRQTQFIAAAMFWADGVPDEIHALFTNSVHRYLQRDNARERRRFNPADVAHNAAHLFHTATQAVLALGPAVVIQLHGFDGATADDDATGDGKATAIVSATRPEGSSEESTRVAATIATVFGATVVRFPEETKSFGGLDNVQGRLVAALLDARFIHIELELELRKRMRDPARAAEWARAIVDACATGPSP